MDGTWQPAFGEPWRMLGLEVLGRLIDVLPVLREGCTPNGELNASSLSSRMMPRPGRSLPGLTEEQLSYDFCLLASLGSHGLAGVKGVDCWRKDTSARTRSLEFLIQEHELQCSKFPQQLTCEWTNLSSILVVVGCAIATKLSRGL